MALAAAALHHALSENHARDAATAYVAVFFSIWWAWWSALSRTAVVAALDTSGTEWLEVATPWAAAGAECEVTRARSSWASDKQVKSLAA